VASLLRELFLNVFSTIKNGELATHEAVKTVEKKKADILKKLDTPHEKEFAESLFCDAMTPRYLLYTPAADILEHIRLYQGMGDMPVVWEVSEIYGLNTRKVTLCAKDRPGLFSKIAGVFTLNNIDILDAQIYTWRNQIALDVFKVNPTPDPIFEDEKWERTLMHLRGVLSENLELSAALSKKIATNSKWRYIPTFRIPNVSKPDQIVIDNDSSSFFTIIEITTYDMPGLLFRITDTLFKLSLDVWLAKIATKVDQVVDVFYVRDLEGRKADDPDMVAMIKETIKKILPG
jgi:[protein-PII] uridylyltransferase